MCFKGNFSSLSAQKPIIEKMGWISQLRTCTRTDIPCKLLPSSLTCHRTPHCVSSPSRPEAIINPPAPRSAHPGRGPVAQVYVGSRQLRFLPGCLVLAIPLAAPLKSMAVQSDSVRAPLAKWAGHCGFPGMLGGDWDGGEDWFPAGAEYVVFLQHPPSFCCQDREASRGLPSTLCTLASP